MFILSLQWFYTLKIDYRCTLNGQIPIKKEIDTLRNDLRLGVFLLVPFSYLADKSHLEHHLLIVIGIVHEA